MKGDKNNRKLPTFTHPK